MRYAAAVGGPNRLSSPPVAGKPNYHELFRDKGCMLGRLDTSIHGYGNEPDTPVHLVACGPTRMLALRHTAARAMLVGGSPFARATLFRISIECEVQDLIDTMKAMCHDKEWSGKDHCMLASKAA